MTGSNATSWSGRFGVALFALMLGFFAFGPALDSLVCHAEPYLDGGAHAASPAADPEPQGHPADGACAHGHCHHPAMDAPPAPGVAARTDPPAAREPARTQSTPSFGLLYGLERPPRD